MSSEKVNQGRQRRVYQKIYLS